MSDCRGSSARKGERCFENRLVLPTSASSASSLSITVPILIFNLVHIYHHLYTEGIGLWQLMDYYMLLKVLELRSESGEVRERATAVVEELGLERFASALMWVLQTVFESDSLSLLWMLGEPNERDDRLVLDEILCCGNFGHMDENRKALKNKWTIFCYVNDKAFCFWRFDH